MDLDKKNYFSKYAHSNKTFENVFEKELIARHIVEISFEL